MPLDIFSHLTKIGIGNFNESAVSLALSVYKATPLIRFQSFQNLLVTIFTEVLQWWDYDLTKNNENSLFTIAHISFTNIGVNMKDSFETVSTFFSI